MPVNTSEYIALICREFFNLFTQFPSRVINYYKISANGT